VLLVEGELEPAEVGETGEQLLGVVMRLVPRLGPFGRADVLDELPGCLPQEPLFVGEPEIHWFSVLIPAGSGEGACRWRCAGAPPPGSTRWGPCPRRALPGRKPGARRPPVAPMRPQARRTRRRL